MLSTFSVALHTKAFIVHSAWSESSAACPRPRDRHQKGGKLAPGAFATLERRGPKGRADALALVVLCKKSRAEEPIFMASDQKRQILTLVVSP